MRILRIWLGGLAVAVACGNAAQSGAPAPSYRRDLLTHEEIINSAQQGANLYVALQSLRPQFLAAPMGVRPATAAQTVLVYVNGNRQAGLESLKSLLASNVAEVRYLDPMKASTEYGPIAGAGALIVTLASPSREPFD